MVIGIIVLFIGTSITTSISGANWDSSYLEKISKNKKIHLSEYIGNTTLYPMDYRFSYSEVIDLAVTNFYDDDISVLFGDGLGGFGDSQYYPVGDGPIGIVAGDFNSDNILDLAVANFYDDDVCVLLNNGSGVFRDRQNYSVGNGPKGIVAGDFNSDSILDLAVTNGKDDDISILLNNGSGVFGERQDYPVGDTPGGIVTGDFDSDNNLDLALTNWYDNDISVLFGDGLGGFGDRKDYKVRVAPIGITTGDFNSDNILDLAETNRADNGHKICVLLNNGSGGFVERQDYTVGWGPWGIVAGDFNSNNSLDLAVTSFYDNYVSVLLNNGSGGFGERQDYTVGHTPMWIVAGDFNSDIILDLAVANHDDFDVSVLFGDGLGGFGDRQDYTVGNAPWWIVAGDFGSGSGYLPPDAPIIDGPKYGILGVEYQYSFLLSDHDDDAMYLRVNWGREETDSWQGPYNPGTTIKLNHTWVMHEGGTFTIRAQAKDIYDTEGPWGELQVTMPRNKATYNSLLLWFLERFPLLEQLILLIL